MPTIVSEIRIRFQGGFAGGDCTLVGKGEGVASDLELTKFYPKDNSSLQVSNYFMVTTTIMYFIS